MRTLWLLALILPSFTTAESLHFSWDAGAGYPAGTTYELQVNGESFTGIATTDHTVNVAVAGDRHISARVRAVTTTGVRSDWDTYVRPATQAAPTAAVSYAAKGKTMAATVVQWIGNRDFGPGLSVTLPVAPTPGNKLLALIGTSYYQTPRIASISGFSADIASVNGNTAIQVLSKTVVAGDSATQHVTVTPQDTQYGDNHVGFILIEIAGANNDNFYQFKQFNSGTVTPSATATEVGTLPLAVLMEPEHYAGITIAPTSWGSVYSAGVQTYWIGMRPSFAVAPVATDTTTSYGATWNLSSYQNSAGLLLINPAASSQTGFEYTAKGGIALGGSASMSRVFSQQASGGLEIGGKAAISIKDATHIPPLRENWFTAGAALLKQLRAECPQFQRYAYAPSLDLVHKLLAGKFPTVFVVPGPLSGGEAAPRQTWYVIVYARNVEKIDEGSGLLLEAGALVSAVLNALSGFVPGPEFSPLYMPDESHRYPDIGQGLYMLTYATRIEPDFWPSYS